MSTAKITKLIFHKFLNFRHVELNLKDTATVIDAVKQPPEVVANFIAAIKFMLDNSEDQLDEEMRYDDYSNNSINEPTFIEMHILEADGANWIFRKTLQTDDDLQTTIIHTLNDHPTTQNLFKERLIQLGFELSNTLAIDAQMIDRIAMMREESRGAFIEKFYTTPEFVFKYQNFKNRIEKMKKEIKDLHDFQKELKSEKEIEKAKVGSLKKFRDTVKEYNKSNEEFLLFDLYHNNKEINDGPRKITKLKKSLEKLKKNLSNTSGNNYEEFLALEEDSLRSNLNLRTKLKEKLKVEQELEGIRQEIELLELQMNENFVNESIKPFQEEIDRNKKNLLDLDALKVKLEPIHEEFLALKKIFSRDNLKVLVPYSTLNKLIFSKVESVEQNEKHFQSQLSTLVTNQSLYNDKIKTTEDERVKIINDMEVLVNEKISLCKKIQSKSMAISKLEQITTLKPKTKTDKQMILDKLRIKFSYSIVGRLCDLFDVKPVNGIEVKHHHILDRLGKYSEAIVVDSQEIAEKCVQFLKLQGHLQINTIIMPLTECNEVSTAELMKKFKQREDCKAEPIENFIEAKHPEIMKVMMNILKPTIVTDLTPNIRLIFEDVNEEIRVTCFDGYMTFNPDGTIQTHSRFLLDADFPDDKILELKETLQDTRIELIELNAQLDILNLKLASYGHKRDFLDRYTIMLNSLKKANYEAILMTKKKIDETEETLKKLVNIKGFEEMKKKFEEFKKIIQPLEVEYFNEFLEKSGYQSVEKYEEDSQKVFPLSNYESNRKFYTSKLEANERIKSKALDANTHANQQKYESAKNRLEVTQKTFETIDSELVEIKQQNDNINADLKESYRQTLEKRTELNELEKRVESLQLQICDEMINIQIALTENFQLLYSALINCDQIPLNNGSLLELLNVPGNDEIDENFNLVKYGIEGLDINFDELDAELKSESDVPKKKNDMIKKLRQLNQFLDEFALDVTGDEEHLSNTSEKLKLIVAETRKLNQNLSNVTEEFQNLCEERERRFDECLGVINGEIEKFCTVGLQGKTKGLLKATEKNELCQHGVQYAWINEDQIEEVVNDRNRNYEAAFAMLMGIIKVKKQQFLILNDAIKSMLNEIDLKPVLEYLTSDENLQVLAMLTSQVVSIEGHCDYSIVKRGERFVLLPKI